MDGESMNFNSEAITQHLLFYKALIDDDEGSQRIDRYMSILEDYICAFHRQLIDYF